MARQCRFLEGSGAVGGAGFEVNGATFLEITKILQDYDMFFDMSLRSHLCLPTLMFACAVSRLAGYSFPNTQSEDTLSLDRSYASINTICLELTNRTGVKHSASGELGNRKITVVCQDIQPNALRSELAAYFSAEWQQSDDGFKLALLPSTAQKESLERQTELTERKAWLRDVLSFLAWCDKQDRAVTSSLSQGVADYSGPKLSALTRKDIQALSGRTSLFPAGTQFKALGNAEDALIRGDQLLVFDRSATPPGTFFIAKLMGHEDLTIIELRSSGPESDELIPFPELIRRDRQFQKGPAPEPSDTLVALSGMAPLDLTALEDPGYRSRALGLSEHARFIAKRYKVPVIAEVFRAAVTHREFQVPGTLGEYLAHVRRTSKGLPFATVLPAVSRGGWVELRYQDAAQLRDTEVPEAILSPLESEWQRGRSLSLDHYAKVASALQTNRTGFFRRDNLLVRFPALPLRTHLQHLRLIGSLSSTQRQAAAEGLMYKSLTAIQKRHFRDAFAASLASSIIGRDKVDPFLRSEDAVPIALKLSSLPAPVPMQDLEMIRLPTQVNPNPAQGNPKPEMIQGGTLVQFRFLIDGMPAMLTALRLLTPQRLPQ